jgi:endoglycosylceramidase
MKRLLLLVAACSSTPHATSPLASDGTHLRDDHGRIALLRGINARVDGVFDVTFSDGRIALEPIPPLDESDCTRMHELGLDFLRLPINWSAIEPAQGVYDDGYLDRVDAAVQCAARAGLYVMIDLHEDAYSKEIGEDGAPLWAIQPPPQMLLQGPLTDLGTRRTSQQVAAAFDSFFAEGDPSGLQAAFDAMLDHVVRRWADDPAVIGFEIFNEPPVGEDLVDAFSKEAAATVRAAAPDKLVVFEPTALRNLLDFAPKAKAAFPVASSVYAPHIYTYVFAPDPTALENLDPADLEVSVSGARDEAKAWHTPMMIGEYGIGPTAPNADLWMQTQATLHDRYLASDAFWLWKEESQDSWGVFDKTADGWTERPQVVAWLSRPHAARIAGTVETNEYDAAARSLHLVTHGGGEHSIYIPDGYSVTCNGEVMTASPGFDDIACDGALDVTP